MKTIKAMYGDRVVSLGDDVFTIINDLHPSSEDGHYGQGTLVRLISGVDESTVPGYHFSPGYKTVCRIDAPHAEWVGIRTDFLVLNNEKGEQQHDRNNCQK